MPVSKRMPAAIDALRRRFLLVDELTARRLIRRRVNSKRTKIRALRTRS